MLSFLRRLAPLAFALVMLAKPMPALAWWDFGHATVGEIALANVKPATRAAITRLLARQALLETPTCPAKTIGEAAVWADCIKGLGDRFSYMSSWHYQDHDVCTAYQERDGCTDGNCLSRQIDRQVKLLKEKALPTRERVIALAMLVHLVGDLAQPLHTAEHDRDAGGNGQKADYGMVSFEKLNLHKIWDGYLAERAISQPPALVRAYPAAQKAAAVQGKVADWMRESWEVARAQVYATAVGADYCEKGKDAPGAVDNEEIAGLVPVVRDQVVKGGLRLASLLDEALGS